jgi:outer membrane protein assembly factor BamA
MPLDTVLVKKGAFEIQDYLKSKGRYFANVTIEEGYKPEHTRVIYNISEGPIVRVRSISFTGNAQLATKARLRTQVHTSSAFLTSMGGVFQPPVVDDDCLKLEEYYRDNGYLKCRVNRELKFSDDNRLVDVIFHIQEAERFRVKSVAVEGAESFGREQIGSIIQAKQGDWVNGGIIKADMRNIEDYGGWRGQKLLVQKNFFTVPDEPGVVRIQYEVIEKPPAIAGQVFIVGNDRTKDNVIRRVVGIYPGQTLRYPELRVAERDLARLGIFKNDPETGIRPTVSVIEDGDGQVKDVLVQVQETNTGSFMIGAAVNSEQGLVGSIVLNERNFDLFRPPTSLADIWEGRAFRGAGQEFRIEAVPGTEYQQYSVSLREPFLFDRPYALTTQAYYRDRVYNEYVENRFGGRLAVDHLIDRNWGVFAGARVENVNVSHVPFGAPPDYTSVIGSHFLVAPKVGVSYDDRDNFMRPTAGGRVEFTYEHVFGDFTFPVLSLEATRYFTVTQRTDGSGKQVLAARSQVAWQGDDAPVYERFFAGGIRTIRGFEFRGVGPQTNFFEVGGHFMFLNSLEYQVPILANDNLWAVAFVDSGTVERDFSIRDYRVSAGVGLRIIVPMMGPVPIALDFGFPIVRGQGDHEQIFSFWVGIFR